MTILYSIACFVKHYLEVLTGVSFGTTTFIVLTKFPVSITKEAIYTYIVHLLFTGISAAFGGYVAYKVKRYLEKKDGKENQVRNKPD